MKRSYDIAVVGESMSGKSSWIASLFTEEIERKLKSVCRENTEGQTKVAVYYNVCAAEVSLRLADIKWNQEQMENWKDKDGACVTMERLKDILGICPDSMEEMSRFVEEESFQKAVREADPVQFLIKVVNDEAVLKEGFISHIELEGSGSEAVREMLERYGQESILLRDTRGFLDESIDQWKTMLDQAGKAADQNINPEYRRGESKEECIRKMLDDRGVYGIDGCIFMTISNSVALQKKRIKEIYGPLIQSLLEKYPVFLVGRNDDFTRQMAAERKYRETYRDCCSRIMEDEFFSGFDDIRGLLEEYGQEGDYVTALARKHYKELLVANLPKGKWEKYKELYRGSAEGALEEILKGVSAYRADLDKAEKCMQEIMAEYGDKAQQIYDRLFLENIRFYEDVYVYGAKYKYFFASLAKKIQGEYFGGLVGVRGGLSTPVPGGGHVGDAAIDILEAAYRIKEDIYRNLIEELTPAIYKYMEGVSAEDKDMDDVVWKMKQRLTENYQYKQDHNFERLSITGRMIPRTYLKNAYDAARKELGVSESGITYYLKELSEPLKNAGEDQLQYASVVKSITWKLIRRTLL